jgi:hypothetical protein
MGTGIGFSQFIDRAVKLAEQEAYDANLMRHTNETTEEERQANDALTAFAGFAPLHSLPTEHHER